MKLNDILPGYFGRSDKEIEELWEKATIFLDTNVLLDLGDYSSKTFDEFRSVMTHKFFENRFFICYQVGIEFGLNRSKRNAKQEGAKSEIKSKLTGILREFDDWIQKNYRNHVVIDTKSLRSSFSEGVNKIIEHEIDSIEMDLQSINQRAEEFILELIDDRVTEKPSNDRLKEIYAQAKIRFADEIPPGYKDDKEKDDERRKYADLVIWLEMIRFCEAKGIKDLIFVTNDNKEDWWWRMQGKTLGPRPELVQEMRDHGIRYHQYTSERFLKYAFRKTGLPTNNSALAEANDLAKKIYTSVSSDLNSRDENYFLFLMDNIRQLYSMFNSNKISKPEYYDRVSKAVKDAIIYVPKRYVGNTGMLEWFIDFFENNPGETMVTYASGFAEDFEDSVNEEIIELKAIEELVFKERILHNQSMNRD